MIPESAQNFTDLVRERLGIKLQAVILVGSFARGDTSPTSDVDLCLLVTEIDQDLLHVVGELVRSISTQNEINPALVRLSELKAYPDWFEIQKLRHDGIVLWGRMPDDIVATESELILAKRIAREVLMSSRHYLAVAEQASKFANGKLRFNILKPLSFALRFYHFHKTGTYIRLLSDLAQEYPVLSMDPVKDHQRILSESMVICEEILNT